MKGMVFYTANIDAMPASVPKTAAHATSSNVWRYLLSMARDVCEGIIDETSRNGKIVAEGNVVHTEIQRHIAMNQLAIVDAV